MQQKQLGVTLVEVIVAFVIAGVILLLTIPSVLDNTNNRNTLIRVKATAQGIVSAASTFREDNGANVIPRGVDIATLMNFTTTSTTETITGGARSCAAGGVTCFLFKDGGVLQASTFQPVNDDIPYFFAYDPDGGAGQRQGMTYVFYYRTGRITTPLGDNAGATVAPTAFRGVSRIVPDPAYVDEWLQNP